MGRARCEMPTRHPRGDIKSKVGSQICTRQWFDLEVLIGESAAGRQEKQERKLSSEDSSMVWKQKIRLRNPNSEFKNREETVQRKQKLATRMQKYRADYK